MKKTFWKRDKIAQLRELIDQKSNKELCEIFDCNQSELTTICQRYKVRRDPALHEVTEEQKKETAREGLRRQRERFPEQAKARDAVAKSVNRGVLIKPEKCEKCGKTPSRRGLHFHHTEGYEQNKWLVGAWLCNSCHREEHGGTH
jgi:hypothetical protein